MSCGNPHAVDCRDVLDRVYSFIDGELGPADLEQIRHHLDECGPCLTSFDLERMLKALVARSCRETAPSELRQRVLLRLSQVRVEVSET
jgi:mycothiol system anti-sigma-R factor